MEQKNQLANKLAKLRADSGLTTRQVMDKSGVDHSLLSKIERGQIGQPSQDILRRLAELYEADIAELYTLAGYKVFRRLPNYDPYLRSKYNLPAEAIDELKQHFDYIKQKYEQGQDQDQDHKKKTS